MNSMQRIILDIFKLPHTEKEEIEKKIAFLLQNGENQPNCFSGTFPETIKPNVSNNSDRRSTRRRKMTHHLH